MPGLLLASAIAAVSYLLGSVPFGLILTKASGLGDIRRVGSGNIGATNVLRTGHKGLAAATLVLDAGKGALAVALARRFGMDAAAIAAVAAVLGHLFPLWLGFKGGKGVATAAGALLVYAWPVGVAAGVTWLGVALVTRYSSLAAITATALAPIYAIALTRDLRIALTVLAVALLVLARHRANFARLRRGEESRMSFGKARVR